MQFGVILKELLIEKGISQKQFAADLNLAPTTVGNYIRGYREPDFDTLRHVARYFNVSTDYLLDKRTGKGRDHLEDELLRLYRSTPKELKDLFMEQARLIATYNLEEKIEIKSENT